MEKNFDFLPLGLFCLFSFKLFLFGSSLSDALVLSILAASAFGFQQRKTKALLSLEDKIKKLEEQHSIKVGEIKQITSEVAEVKGLVGGIKLGQLRSNNRV